MSKQPLPFAIGAIVTLTGGGPNMTVIDYVKPGPQSIFADNLAVCAYFDAENIGHSMAVNPTSLVLVV